MTQGCAVKNDRELLEAAAKVSGIGDVDVAGRPCVLVIKSSGIHQRGWNPLTNDGDALRLAVKCGIEFQFSAGATWVELGLHHEPHNGDPYAATRRAIVRAAAEIAKGLEHA
jgi:hypothetical protein